MHYASRVDYKAIAPAQAIKLSKIANISTKLLRHYATYTDMIQSLMSFARAFNEDYGIRFDNVRSVVVDILEDIFPPFSWLPTIQQRIYATVELAR